MTADAEKYAAEDAAFKEKVEAKNSLENYWCAAALAGPAALSYSTDLLQYFLKAVYLFRSTSIIVFFRLRTLPQSALYRDTFSCLRCRHLN